MVPFVDPLPLRVNPNLTLKSEQRSRGTPPHQQMVPTFMFIHNMSKRHHGTILDPLPLDMTSEASLEKKSQEDPPSIIQWYHTLVYDVPNKDSS